MKELKKLAIILRALGITAKVVSEEITYKGVHEYDNIFCECGWTDGFIDLERTAKFIGVSNN